MPRPRHGEVWWARPILWVELFVVSNLAFLAVDVRLAHAINAFAHWGEWIPVVFSLAATGLLLAAMAIGGIVPVSAPNPEIPWTKRLARGIGLLVGTCSIGVGIAGLLWHLDGDFFRQATLKNLVYTAPFMAPLAYTGLGLLALLNRMVDPRTLEWARWVVLLACGGFLGNFVLSLADHAQNGFFYPSEWIGVVAAAAAIGFLLAAVVFSHDRTVLVMSLALMGIQVIIGLLGFYLHLQGNLANRADSLWDTFVFGAPIFAPLLFADLAALGFLGLWAQARFLAREGSVGDASTSTHRPPT